jgi:Fe-S cluster biogenesis protein NfuA
MITQHNAQQGIIMKDYIPNSDPLYDRVINALETVRPYLQVDGGDCQLVGITKDMVVNVKLLGACGSCPMSTLTLRAGVEQAIKKAIPEIARVEQV